MTDLRPAAGARSPGEPDQPLNPWLEDRLWALGPAGLVLDLGCGRGYWLERMVAKGLQPVGVEYDEARTALAARHAPVVVSDATRLPLDAGSVGLVWCIHVLHHLHEPAAVLEEIRRVLKPGGHLILAETVEDNPIVRVGRNLWPHWDGVDVHARFTASSLLSMLRAAGLVVVDHRQHGLVSFAVWASPVGARLGWNALSRLEGMLPAAVNRWGAHLECVARAPAP